MEKIEAIKSRRSVRVYRDTQIDGKTQAQILQFIETVNKESGQHFQVFFNEPNAFTCVFAYGKLVNVKNYIAVVGKKTKGSEELCGYYGEKIVIFLQSIGINTCWAGISYKKSKVFATVNNDEKLYLLIAMGYGKHLGKPRRSKSFDGVADLEKGFNGEIPEWFKKGVESALLAPTAMNQQKFKFTLKKDGTVILKRGIGFYTKTDIGIVKYHFEIGATPHIPNIIYR